MHRPSQFSRQRFRTKRLYYAVGTSLLAKASGLTIVFIAIPVAVHCLGKRHFVLYSMIASLFGWLSLANIGVGPSVTAAIAAADSTVDRSRQGSILSSVFYPITAVATPIVAILFLLVLYFPVDQLFGQNYVGDRHSITQALLFVILLFALNAFLSVAEAAQLGFQEQHSLNIRTLFSNLLAFFAIMLMPRVLPTVLGLLLALHVPAYFTRMVNAYLFFRRRPFLLPRWKLFSGSLALHLVTSGIMFCGASTVGNFLCHYLPIILSGRSHDADYAAVFSAAMQFVLLSSAFLAMFTIPLRPSITDAIARNDMLWLRKAVTYMLLGGGVVALASICLIVLFGEAFFRRWLGDSVVPSRPLLASMGCYFALITWENLCATVLIATDRIALLSGVYVLRSAIAAVVLILYQAQASTAFPFVVLSASVVIVTLYPFTRAVLCLDQYHRAIVHLVPTREDCE
jgi:O-antigen/teichoic acid export membrane protein